MAGRGRREMSARGRRCSRPTQTTTRASRCCPRSTRRWWSLRGRRPAPSVHRRRLLERSGVAARGGPKREQQARDQDALREHARVRRHGRRAQDHVSMQSGHKLVLDDGARRSRCSTPTAAPIKMNAGGQVQIQANSTVEVTASAVNVHAATATFDGIVNCQTLIANVGVVSPSYTPGAGNIW